MPTKSLSRRLTALLEEIDNSSDETRYTYHEPLMDAIHAVEADGQAVPQSARDLAEALLLELTEARFDNMPV